MIWNQITWECVYFVQRYTAATFELKEYKLASFEVSKVQG